MLFTVVGNPLPNDNANTLLPLTPYLGLGEAGVLLLIPLYVELTHRPYRVSMTSKEQ